MKLVTLMENTPRGVRERDNSITKVMQMSLGVMKTKPPRKVFHATVYSRDTAKRVGHIVPHKCYIASATRTDRALSIDDVLVYCDCEYFLYHSAWVLYRRGAALKDISNGEPPDVMNPGYRAFAGCKHLYHLANIVLSKGM